MIILPFFEVDVDERGWLDVWYMGTLVAMVDADGTVLMQNVHVPIFLIHYLILQPRPDITHWN